MSASLLLDLAVRRGFLSEAQAAECLHSIPSESPVAWLLERKLLAPDEAKLLASLVEEHDGRTLVRPESSPNSKTPQRIGPYEIVRELGHGGMGVVYAARDTRLGREVALKVIRGAVGEADLKRFHREAEVTANLRHPHIVNLFDVGEEKGSPYFAMTLVEGKNLEEARLSRRDGVRVLQAVADAVHYAHEAGVLHRDIKPANILVDKNGEGFITDFGLARQVQSDSSLTLSGQVFGTPAYMSPEQARGDGPHLDCRTDVWSLGATLYFVLTGRAPFESKTAIQVLNQVLQADPVWPRKVDPKIHSDLEAVCLKALEKKRDRRYATAGELAADLKRYLEGEPISARPPSTAFRVRRWATRHRLGIGLGLLLLLLGGGSLLGARWETRRRSFREAEAAAIGAFDEKDWAQARLESERGLRLRANARLSEIAAESRRQLEAKESDERRIRWLQEQFKPLEELITQAQPYFYIPGPDLKHKLSQVETALMELTKIAQEAEYARYSEVWRVLGIGWFLVGDFARAEEALRTGETLNPEDGWINFHLGRIYLRRAVEQIYSEKDSVPEALAAAGKWTELASRYLHRTAPEWSGARDIDRHLADTYRALVEANGERVLDLCEEGMRRFEAGIGTEEYWILTILAKYGTDAPLTVQILSRAIERKPHYDLAYLMRAVWRERDDLAGAIADYDAAIVSNPRFGQAYRRRGYARQKKGEWETAREDFDRAVELEPENALSFLWRGSFRLRRADSAGAVQDLTRATELDPKLAVAWYYRGWARQLQGEEEGAIADYTRGIEVDPQRIDAYLGRGLLRARRGRFEEAIADYTRMIELDPTSILAHEMRAIAREKKGDLAGTLEDLTWAVDHDSKSAKPWIRRARFRGSLGDADGVIADCTRAIELDPNATAAYEERAWAKTQKADYEGAIADYSKAVEIDPANPEILYSRAWAKGMLGDDDGAIADCTRVIELKPGEARAHHLRGVAKALKTDDEGAIADYDRAIELDPAKPEAYADRAAARARKGNTAGAIADYRKALEVAPDGWTRKDEATNALAKLLGNP